MKRNYDYCMEHIMVCLEYGEALLGGEGTKPRPERSEETFEIVAG
jgi:hypothetical protein